MKKVFITLIGALLMLSLVVALETPGIHEAGTGQGLESGELTQNIGEGQKIQLQLGEQLGENGQQIMVQQESNNQIRLEVGEKSAKTSMNINQETVNGKVKLSTQLSNGRNAEIKVMPDAASETALERLRLKTCSEENNCSIELKEVGSGEQMKAAYEIKTERNSKVLGLFQAKMQVQAQVDAENGEILRVSKPWWAFLASEPAE